ncbi:archease [Dactylosporangium sp. NPDC005572]|uniref:archease n=1 Tax=Dactylosporangium sp. NPDC005572 TaxID=3156889 RepID=UPI0033AE0B54
MTTGPAAGYELLPHTADVMLTAWAPTAEECIEAAVRALVACFADVRAVGPARLVGFACEPAPDDELLVEVLEEAIYLLDTEDVVPVQVALARTARGGLAGDFGVIARSDVPLVGPLPKAVTRHGLRFARHGGLWRCAAVIDV